MSRSYSFRTIANVRSWIISFSCSGAIYSPVTSLESIPRSYLTPAFAAISPSSVASTNIVAVILLLPAPFDTVRLHPFCCFSIVRTTELYQTDNLGYFDAMFLKMRLPTEGSNNVRLTQPVLRASGPP